MCTKLNVAFYKMEMTKMDNKAEKMGVETTGLYPTSVSRRFELFQLLATFVASN